ncbi:hypothetical protein [Tuwongella immobilis]|uniref:Uncharacterized protein n=1 Tax=Tuwongella immobilis TaxID=692036 RepID=A0A6C2YGQ5_9BACT|nr:hypothetical protein [Tuwongella immobilis]VIP00688.1 unnamed protein product [Tuwongella immobilis]VTR96794.1 unnamed protein product [Tuwongella immobilis]
MLRESSEWVPVSGTLIADSSFPTRGPTLTEPTGDGVVTLTRITGEVRSQVVIVPYAYGDENGTFHLRILGWRRLQMGSGSAMWIPTTLAKLTATLGTTSGLAGAIIDADTRFADTLTLTVGSGTIRTEVVSPADDTIGHVTLDTKGVAKLELQFARDVDVTSMNALIAAI